MRKLILLCMIVVGSYVQAQSLMGDFARRYGASSRLLQAPLLFKPIECSANSCDNRYQETKKCTKTVIQRKS